MNPWKERLKQDLEPMLADPDTCEKLSKVYHDMPFGIFLYSPADEWMLRGEIRRLKTRLEAAGKRIHVVSLAQCLQHAFEREMPIEALCEAETLSGLEAANDTVHQVLSEYAPLIELVLESLPSDLDSNKDIVWLTRAGALYPVYRTSSLLEQLKGRLVTPCILFYPGETEGAAGLRFMGVLEAEHNYRPRIF